MLAWLVAGNGITICIPGFCPAWYSPVAEPGAATAQAFPAAGVWLDVVYVTLARFLIRRNRTGGGGFVLFLPGFIRTSHLRSLFRWFAVVVGVNLFLTGRSVTSVTLRYVVTSVTFRYLVPWRVIRR